MPTRIIPGTSHVTRENGANMSELAPIHIRLDELEFSLTDPDPDIVNMFPSDHVSPIHALWIAAMFYLDVAPLKAGNIRYDGERERFTLHRSDGTTRIVRYLRDRHRPAHIYLHVDGRVTSPNGTRPAPMSGRVPTSGQSPSDWQRASRLDFARVAENAAPAPQADRQYASCPGCGRENIRELEYEDVILRFCTQCRYIAPKTDELPINPGADVEEHQNRQIRETRDISYPVTPTPTTEEEYDALQQEMRDEDAREREAEERERAILNENAGGFDEDGE